MFDPCETCCVPDDLMWECEECRVCGYNEMMWARMIDEMIAEKQDLLSLDDDTGLFI